MVTAVQLGLAASPEHFTASQAIENQAAAGEITGSMADFLKGQNLIDTGYNPGLAAMGAYPYQVGQEVFRDVRDQGISGLWSGLQTGAQAGYDNLRGIGAGLYDKFNPGPVIEPSVSERPRGEDFGLTAAPGGYDSWYHSGGSEYDDYMRAVAEWEAGKVMPTATEQALGAEEYWGHLSQEWTDSRADLYTPIGTADEFIDAVDNRPLGESLFSDLNPLYDLEEAKDRINELTGRHGYSQDQTDAIGHAAVSSWAEPVANYGTLVRDSLQGQIGKITDSWQPFSSIPPLDVQGMVSWLPGIPSGNLPEEVIKDQANTRWGMENRDISFSDLLEQAAPGGDLIIRGPYDEALPIDTSVPLTDEINFSGPVQDAAREDWNRRDQMAQWYERAFIDPTEYGIVAPTVEQRREAIRGVQDAPEGFWGALQSRIADLIPAAEASIAPIGEEGFSPTIDARTLDGPVVGSPDVPSGFEALASLIKDDPDVAKKYTTSPGQSTAALANLVANTGVETFADIPDTPWTPPAPVVPDITQALADFSAIRDANEDRRNREQDERERELEQAADDRREAEQEARVEAARNKTAEKKRIAKENRERKAEEKRIADKQAAEEKERRAVEKQMADMLKRHNEAHQAYLDRKRKEEDRRKRQGYGVGGMWT